MENKAQIADFQSRLIDRLDKVVAGSEALMMNGSARTEADFERLKSEIQGLLDVVLAFERQCHGERDLRSVKETMAALKRSVAVEREKEILAEAGQTVAAVSAGESAEDKLSFGFEVLPDPMADATIEPAVEKGPMVDVADPMADATIEPAVEKEPMVDVADPMADATIESAVEKEPMVDVADPMADATIEPAVEKEPMVDVVDPMADATIEPAVAEEGTVAGVTVMEEPARVVEKPKPIEPELGLQFDDVPGEPEPTPVADEIFEAIKQENMAQFSVREEDQPQSYITQLTAMAQAQVKGEQDMSGVAVSSTARPDTAPEPVSSGDSLMESLRSTRANLHGGQLRTMVDKFKAPQTIYDIQHTRTVDLKMAIGVNEKYLLTRELFGDNVKDYTDAVSRLNEAKDAAAAQTLWTAMAQQRAWDEASLAYATFYDLLRRRFPDLA